MEQGHPEHEILLGFNLEGALRMTIPNLMGFHREANPDVSPASGCNG